MGEEAEAAVDELRRILGEVGLDEVEKWRQPCFVHQGRNVAIVGRRKNGVTIGYFRGALLEDPDGVLVAPGPNSRTVRNLDFASRSDVLAREAQIADYTRRAMALAESGATVPRASEADMPDVPELDAVFAADPELGTAFEALTPGRRRGYLIFAGGAKQPSTRIRRLQKHRERILAGKGMHDCICGKSARMPRCDGSHKNG